MTIRYARAVAYDSLLYIGHVTGRLLVRTLVAMVDIDYTAKSYSIHIAKAPISITMARKFTKTVASPDAKSGDTPAASKPSIALVIPAFNEVATLRDIVTRALRQVDHIIVVDDGSEDGTAAIVRDLPVTILRNPENLGKAASLRRGMAHALAEGASAVVTIDADGQHEPEDIPRLVAAHVENPRSIIVGARLHEKEKIPRARYLANRFANFLTGWAAGYPIADSQSGFRLYPAAVLSALDICHDTSRGFAFETAMLIKAARVGVMSVPVEISAIYRSGARASHFRPLVDIFLIGLVIWGSILSRGFDIPGLVRSRRGANRSQPSHSG